MSLREIDRDHLGRLLERELATFSGSSMGRLILS